jgi:hypothetical protein
MAVPTPPAVAVGQKIAASAWNSYVAGGFSFLDQTSPLVHLVTQAAQSIPNAAFDPIIFGAGTEVVDRTGMHSTTVTASRVFVGLEPGLYIVAGTVAFAGSAAGSSRSAAISLNGTIVQGGIAQIGPSGSAVVAMQISTLVVSGAAGDYVELLAQQNSGAALSTFQSAATACTLTIRRIGSA